jgi:hypothetical protein
MTLAPAALSAIGTAIDAIAAVQFAELEAALAADGWAPDDIAAVEAWWVAELIAWRQEQLPAILAALVAELALQ